MHSWAKFQDNESDSNESYDERVSDQIPSTCAGGRKDGEKANTTRSSQNLHSPFITPPREPQQFKENQNQPKVDPSRGLYTNHEPNTTPKATGHLSAEKLRNKLIAERKNAQTPTSNYSEDELVRQLRLKIQNHPRPGNGATRVEQLLRLPWRVVFGHESRMASSRELEVQRAGSSFKPMCTPLDKGFEAELPLHDSPEIDHFPNGFDKSQQNWNGQQQQQKGYQQTETTNKQQPANQQIFQQSPNIPQQPNLPLRLDKENQTEDIQIDVAPPIFEKFKKQNYFYNKQQSLFRNSSLSSNKFVPSYLPLSPLHYHRPYPMPPPINVDSWALGPKHYRRIYLDNLVKRIQENESKQATLRAQLNRFDEKSRQELDELELLTREQQLDVRRRQYEERLREQEELENRILNNTTTTTTHSKSASPLPTTTRQPPPASILRKTPLPRTNLPHVAFSSPPIRSPSRNVNRHESHRPPENPDDRRAKKYIENRGIEEEDRRINYVIKWNSNQEQLKKAKRANPRINLKSNPTSIFQHIPGNSSTRQ
ncbi:hypothetical protein ACQ4LE_006418 [Meloidogyne hapla]